jgi:hypothetical protein
MLAWYGMIMVLHTAALQMVMPNENNKYAIVNSKKHHVSEAGYEHMDAMDYGQYAISDIM